MEYFARRHRATPIIATLIANNLFRNGIGARAFI